MTLPFLLQNTIVNILHYDILKLHVWLRYNSFALKPLKVD